jgi:hypothetical protein
MRGHLVFFARQFITASGSELDLDRVRGIVTTRLGMHAHSNTR